MEITKKDNDKLLDIFNKANESDYIECELKVNKELYYDQFINIVNNIKNITNNEYDEQDILDISLPNNDIRTSIMGVNNIETYCKTNKIEDIDKESITETFKKKDSKMSRYIFDNDDDIYVNIKTEVEKNKKSNSFEVLDSDINKLIENNLKYFKKKKFNFNNKLKYFRYKKRYSIFDSKKIFRFDFTIVKSAESNGKSIYETNLLNKEETFEIEIEYVNKTDNYELFRNTLINNTRNILRSIKDSYFIINKKEENIVKEIYSKYVKSIYKKETEDKIKVKTNKNVKMDNYKKDLLKQLSKNITEKKLKDEILYLKNRNKKDDVLINPKPVTLNMTNIRDDDNNTILNNFSVTEKADGETMLIYVLGINHLDAKIRNKYTKYEGNIYLIDMNFNVFKTRIKCIDLIGTIISGEYIRDSNNNTKLNYFAAFDIYNHTNYGYMVYYPLYGEDDNILYRYNVLKETIEKMNKDVENNNYGFVLKYKEFYFGNGKDIFNKSKLILDKINDKVFPYYCDGLIYTPIDVPINYNGNPLFDIYPTKTWNMNYKWKPYYDNSIDFLIEIEQEEIDYGNNIVLKKDLIKTKIIEKPDGNEYIKYKTLNLYCGYNYDIDSVNPCKLNKKGNYRPVKFKPSNPRNDDAYKCYLRVNDNDDVVDDKGYIIQSNTIVEFVYLNFKENENNYNKDQEFRWKPLRTRYDKTLEYKNGLKERKELLDLILESRNNNKLSKSNLDKLKRIKNIDNINNESDINLSETNIKINYGNNYKVANNIWNNIHDTITEEMISTGDNIPSKEDEEKYYNRDLNVEREKSITYNMQKFHNIEVKLNTLLLPLSSELKSKNKDVKLLDLACGKAGDLYKWNKSQIDTVVGIDINHNNIYHHIDGACKRYNDYTQKYNKYTKCHFMVGDSGKDIKKNQAINEQESIYLFQSIKDIMNSKFDIISVQFAIHYFFEKDTILNTFIDNVDNYLKKGGYFIGTCLDGRTIFDSLKDKEYIEGVNEKGTLWKIQKKYDSKTFTNKFNQAINVYLYSINNTIEEYLVDFDFLTKKLKERNIELVNDKSSNLFSEVYDEKYKLEDKEKELSFMYRYFIFKKMK